MEYRDQLLKLREDAGLKQTEMAAIMGMSPRGYQDLETGKVEFRLIHANAMWMVSLKLANMKSNITLAPATVRNEALALASQITGNPYSSEDVTGRAPRAR